MTTRRVCQLVLFMAALAVAGCGNGGPVLYPVSGMAKYQDQPIEDGEIILRPKDSRGKAYAAKISGGKFSLDCTEGAKTVEIVGYRENGKFSTANPGEKVAIREMYIPKKYNEKTELVGEVKPGGAPLDFSLN